MRVPAMEQSINNKMISKILVGMYRYLFTLYVKFIFVFSKPQTQSVVEDSLLLTWLMRSYVMSLKKKKKNDCFLATAILFLSVKLIDIIYGAGLTEFSGDNIDFVFIAKINIT